MRSIISDCLCHANTQMSPVGLKIINTCGRTEEEEEEEKEKDRRKLSTILQTNKLVR